MFTRNMSWEGKGGRYAGLTTLPPLYPDRLEIWEPQLAGALRPVQACTGIAVPFINPKARR